VPAVVTGAAGFIGARVSDALAARGALVRRVDIRPGPGIVRADVTRRDGWSDVLDGADLVVHCAAIVGDLGPDAYHREVNVGGTRTVLEAAAEAGVDRVVHLSSHVVYGPQFGDGVDERSPVRRSGVAYTDTKIASEHVALRLGASGRLRVTIVRPGDVYGPESVQWVVRPIELLRRRMLVLPDGGRGILCPTYVDDVVAGVVAAATEPAASGEILNLTASRGVPARDFFRPFADALGVGLPAVPAPVARGIARAVHAGTEVLGRPPLVTAGAVEYVTHRGVPSNAKAAAVLGWRPEVALGEGMERTLAWARDRGLLPSG
jgi:2-alkyl-3-oxoalkanoate reductase